MTSILDHLRPGPSEFGGRPPMHAGQGHPSMHMRHEQGKMFQRAEEGQRRFTIEKDLKPGPVPGMRPTGPGFGPGIQQPRGNQGSGTMGILMPLYTTGIVIFFVYTVMRIMFKKNDESSGDQDERSNPRRLHQQLRNQTIPHEYLHPQNNPKPQQQATKKPQPSSEPEKPTVAEKIKPIPPKETVQKVESESKSPDPRDEEIMILKQRLEETEKAMQMVVSHMAALSSHMPNPETPKEKKVVPSDVKESEEIKDNDETSEASEDDKEDEEDDEDHDESASESETNGPVEEEMEIESLSSVPIAQES